MSELSVVFENSNFIAIDKPAGFLSVPARTKEDARPCLGLILEKTLKTQIFPVHRLDFETSGLILYAKNPKSHQVACGFFAKHFLSKTYQAISKSQISRHDYLLKSDLPDSSFAYNQTDRLWTDKMKKGKKRAYLDNKAGDISITEVCQVEAYLPEVAKEEHAHTKKDAPGILLAKNQSEFALWTLKPKTGRSHQLRLALFVRGFPIIGDHLYSMPLNYKDCPYFLPPQSDCNNSIALRATQLSFKEEAIGGVKHLIKEVQFPLSLSVSDLNNQGTSR